MRAAIAVLLSLIVVAAPGVAAGHKTPTGYLKPGDIDVVAVLPPAPVAGDPRYDSDRAMFLKTRKLIGSPRWAMATNDVQYGNEAMLHDFSCAAGVTLTVKNARKLTWLMDRAGRDTQKQTNIAKDTFKRLRPFQIDEGDICQSKEDLAKSFDYPSGHTTGGWTWAMVLADVLPERATAILARGRAYGESRIVCGAHNASAVEAGRLSATVTLEAVRNKAAYKKDVKAAQAEIRALRKSRKAGKPLACEAEAALVSQDIFAPAP
jgi:acid phosphatase (class A)